MAEHPPKVVTGYCEPWSLRAGESVTLFAASHTPGPAELSLVRIDCGDPTRYGPGFAEEEIASKLPQRVTLADQPLEPGSYGTVDLAGLHASERVELSFGLLLTRPDEPQTVAWLEADAGAVAIVVEDGMLCADVNGAVTALRPIELAARRWYQVALGIDLVAGTISASVTTQPSASPGRDLLEPEVVEVVFDTVAGARDLIQLVLGGSPAGGAFDGRVGEVSLVADETKLVWDLAREMATRRIVDVSGNDRHGELHQLPARGVTGPTWDRSEQRWTAAPEQWNAVHFHKDDLYDARWAASAELALPDDLPSGIYAFRVQTEHGADRVPFFVRPGLGRPTADVALLMSSATYIAYANHRTLFEGADYFSKKLNLRPEHEYVRVHPEVGRSMYEKHPDGSGVMFSSRRRPVLHVRPGADGWNFTPDTDINAFLKHLAVGHDILGDEDVHVDGFGALAPYRVIVTSSHPEYWSTAMLDALEEWQRAGGRLIYLGGNGFYWRVAFSDGWPGAMELRRAEDGVRNWQTENGESYHAFTGEYGGMWRRNGRAPNELVGVGFAAQGFGKAVHYDVNPASRTSRAAWIWDGVIDDEGRIGTSGLGGGAAGQELDRYDTRLGSPAHAVVLASATEFGPDMVRTKEEFEGSVEYPTPDPYVRADIVFYETPNGGAVFSVGSISWFGALARNGFDNDIAHMTANVVRRFADPEPFVRPKPES
jgi:N,N-dimethylformamidase